MSWHNLDWSSAPVSLLLMASRGGARGRLELWPKIDPLCLSRLIREELAPDRQRPLMWKVGGSRRNAVQPPRFKRSQMNRRRKREVVLSENKESIVPLHASRWQLTGFFHYQQAAPLCSNVPFPTEEQRTRGCWEVSVRRGCQTIRKCTVFTISVHGSKYHGEKLNYESHVLQHTLINNVVFLIYHKPLMICHVSHQKTTFYIWTCCDNVTIYLSPTLVFTV